MQKENQHKELRSGLTTGTCASAVAKAAALMLVSQENISHVQVKLPGGKEVVLELCDYSFNTMYAQCSTIKDAGDDPDITHGAEIIGKAWFNIEKKILITAGKGVGIVTKEGLAIKPGNPAINPTPLKMIHQALEEVIPENTGVTVEISIPKGEELAKKTFNPQLGIVGGLSVLGTTGIVKPMSEEALKSSLVVKLQQVKAYGFTKVIFTPGNYSSLFLKENMNIPEDQTVLTSNYLGFMFEKAVGLEFTDIVLIGHLGKLVKLAGGIFHTHSKVADARNEILAAHYFYWSKDDKGFLAIMECNTTEEAIDYIKDSAFWSYFISLIKKRIEMHVHGEINAEVILLSQKKGVLAKTNNAIQTIKMINEHAHN